MKTKLFFIVLTLSVIGFLFWNFQNSNLPAGRQGFKNQTKSTDLIQIGSQTLSVEVAKSIPEITLGLGQRDTLGSDGMLFVMPVRVIPTFWMKDMQFDLDFVWIDSDKVIDLTENVSAQRGEPDYKLKMYSPRTPATHVLELNAGEIKKRGIQLGQTVQL